jgi:hypothetical protein
MSDVFLVDPLGSSLLPAATMLLRSLQRGREKKGLALQA